MGTIHGFSARSQPSANCAGVTPLRFAHSRTSSRSGMFALNASGVKVRTLARRSGAENLVFSLMTPVRKARWVGPQGHEANPELLTRRQNLVLWRAFD